MAGLMYKDFLAVKGKKAVIILLALTVVYAALRFAFPGTGDEDSSPDLFLWVFPALLAVAGFGLPSAWTGAIMAGDGKNKIKAFTKSLPLGKNSYIASKYLFLASVIFTIMVTNTLWCRIFKAGAVDNSFTAVIDMLTPFVIILASCSLVIAAIELPFFITLGRRKAGFVKTAILECAFLAVIGIVFFGDLDRIDSILDIEKIMLWHSNHKAAVDLAAFVGPFIAAGVYVLSYLLTCAINRNRERETD